MSLNFASIRQPFAYAYGRTTVLRPSLLTEGDVNRLLGATNGADAVRMLTELPMTKYIPQNIERPEQILYAVFHWLQQEVIGMSPSNLQPVFEILWLEDLGTLVSLYRKKEHGFLQHDAGAVESFVSHEFKPTWDTFVQTGKVEVLPINIRTLVERTAEATFDSPQEIDRLVSKEVTTLKLALAKRSGSRLIKTFVQDSIDLKNIRLKLRLGSGYTESLYLPGGRFTVKTFTGTSEQMITAIETSKLSYTLADTIRTGDIAAIEKASSSILAATISRMWNTALSIESTFAFAAITVQNLKLIRSILIGKQNDLSPQEIKSITPPFIRASLYEV